MASINVSVPDKVFNVIVTDGNNCVTKDSIRLEQPGGITATASVFNSCNGKNTGGIDVVIEGGSIPYTYLWDDESESTSAKLYDIDAGTYALKVTDASGCETSTSAEIVSYDTPISVDIVSNKGNYFCPGLTTLVATEGFDIYSWSTGDTQQTITPSSPGEIHLRVHDHNRCSATATININPLRTFQNQQLCLVTVNAENKNEIVWQRKVGFGIASYNIFKESNSSSNLELLTNISFSENSVFIDEESDPNARSHTYSISIVDVCGVESDVSNTHHTMLLQAGVGINGEVNLDWNKYTGFEFETYNIYRGTDINDLSLLTSISNTESKYIDQNPIEKEDYFYVLEVENDFECNPSQLKSSFNNYGVSRSNYLSSLYEPTGIFTPEKSYQELIISPNPMLTSSIIKFENDNNTSYTLSIFNASGEKVYSDTNITNNYYELHKANLSAGVYLVKLKGDKLFVGKLIIQ